MKVGLFILLALFSIWLSMVIRGDLTSAEMSLSRVRVLAARFGVRTTSAKLGFPLSEKNMDLSHFNFNFLSTKYYMGKTTV